MVRDNREWSSLEVRAPPVDSHGDSEKLLLVYGKPLIAHTQRLTEVGDGVALLYRHCSHSGVARVSFNGERLCKIGKGQYRCLHHSLLEKIESCLSWG